MGGGESVKPYNDCHMTGCSNNRSVRRIRPFVPSCLRAFVPVCIALLCLTSCKKEDSDILRSAAVSTEPVPVVLARVKVEPTQRTAEVLGTLWGDEETTISAKVSGRVSDVLKDIGDRATAGEVLVQLDRTDYELIARQKELGIQEVLAKVNLKDFPTADFDASMVPTVQKSRLQAENAEGKLARGKLLHDQTPPLLSDQDFADLNTAADVARSTYQVELLGARALLAEAFSRRADLAVARKILEDATILVPHAVKHIGRPNSPTTQPAENSWAVTARLVSIGEYVKEGTPLFKLVDDDPIRLRANVPERFVPEIAQGQKVFVTIEGYDRPFEGEVRRINAQIDPASRTFQVEARIPNADRRLKPGAFAKASILTRIDREVIYAPAAAVQSFAGVTRVYLVKDGKAVEQTVEPGPPGSARKGWVEIRKGLKPSDEVVVEGRNKLAAGTPVKVAGRK